MVEYLCQHSCVDCGEDDPVVLDFDHRDRGDKFMAISEMIKVPYSTKRLAVEIAKCDVRCANCHRRRTAQQLVYRKAFSSREEWLAARVARML